ncbi:hypothetical protein Pint_14550 [Pistacia integerrima]|uniref:Uncharacterized protein n=1 Tax=Pistacia integerrima TaxID=434235 RepID=A0ACC0Y5T2_9ROSI|nr:hypothetical protein Pint_14550 [Pistacia integerrima]
MARENVTLMCSWNGRITNGAQGITYEGLSQSLPGLWAWERLHIGCLRDLLPKRGFSLLQDGEVKNKVQVSKLRWSIGRHYLRSIRMRWRSPWNFPIKIRMIWQPYTSSYLCPQMYVLETNMCGGQLFHLFALTLLSGIVLTEFYANLVSNKEFLIPKHNSSFDYPTPLKDLISEFTASGMSHFLIRHLETIPRPTTTMAPPSPSQANDMEGLPLLIAQMPTKTKSLSLRGRSRALGTQQKATSNNIATFILTIAVASFTLHHE